MIEKTISRTLAIGAATLTATVSPCSWMYPNYGLQIQIRIESTGETALLLNKSLPFTEATEDDVRTMLASVRIVRCPRCESPAFDPATVVTNSSAATPATPSSACSTTSSRWGST